MKRNETEARQQSGAKRTTDSQKVQKPSGIFVNSICTSAEPSVRQTLIVQLKPTSTK